ncbi:alkaline phosphatase PhoX [Nonomuraea sp. NPDC050536]|uniref:alkaline phosphatase PhoX n=1 Tax=Nonomuraea sp. NPDC050536 TaxID=3364366 RepID=UPI0037C7B545
MRKILIAVLLAGTAGCGVQAANADNPYGITGYLDKSSQKPVAKEEALKHPESLIKVADSLKVRVINDRLPLYLDQGAFWPSDENPQWRISCNEWQKDHPGLLRVNLKTGKAETILTGTESCDPVRRTAWGTIVFGEENGGGRQGGRLYELIDPLHTTGVTLDRKTGRFHGGTGAGNLTARPLLGRLSWEGMVALPSGVVYYTDESRPEKGNPGGAFFKFVPDQAPNGEISDLGNSPLTHGRLYGLRIGKHEGGRDYGQGTQWGQGSWIPVEDRSDPDLTRATATQHLTGYYRPEDMDLDRKALAEGKVRICSDETGNEDEAQMWGDTICLTDGAVDQPTAGVPQVQPFILGGPALNMPDNIAYQPGRGNWIVHEDGDTDSDLQGFHGNDLWSCRPDGPDDDLQSDGCVRIATLNDGSPTGGEFDASGRHFYVVVQWSGTGYGVLLDITGWR